MIKPSKELVLMELELLLYEEESTSLDFKRQEYKFSGATEREKSELLKDILAFANAWRRDHAYILLGVEEVKGARSKPVGIENELDDAQLQEFVNKKTQRPIEFSYKTCLLDGLKIGVIEIPVQQRPIYLQKDYGKLKKNSVYIRRGSSTDEAPPDEVVKMAKAELEYQVEQPKIEIGFADCLKENKLGREIELSPIVFDMSRVDEIEDFKDPDLEFDGSISHAMRTVMLTQALHTNGSARPEYYRELALYEYIQANTDNLSFHVTNSSSVTVTDITVEIIFPRMTGVYALNMPEDLAKKPNSHTGIMSIPRMNKLNSNIINNLSGKTETWSFDKFEESFRIKLTFKKVQPKQTIFCDKHICLSSFESFEVEPLVTVYADNLSNPLQMRLKVFSNATYETRSFLGLTDGTVIQGLNIDEFE